MGTQPETPLTSPRKNMISCSDFPFIQSNPIISLHPRKSQFLDISGSNISNLFSRCRVMTKETSSCSPPNCSEWFVRNVTSSSHKALTKSLATDSIVLLKNEESLLPISDLVGLVGLVGLSWAKWRNWGKMPGANRNKYVYNVYIYILIIFIYIFIFHNDTYL